MVLEITQEENIIEQSGYLHVNQSPPKVNKVLQHNTEELNYVLSIFEGNINPWDTQGIKLYLH